MESQLLLVLAGAAVGGGVFLIAVGARGVEVDAARQFWAVAEPTQARVLRRVAVVVATTAAAFALTGWPVFAAFAAALAANAPSLVGAKATRARAIARTEALASWTEQLRDVVGAAHGIREAIAVTARTAPPEIRPEVERLARKAAHHQRIATPLREFAAEFDDSIADSVIAALALAETAQAGHVGSMLGAAAEMARDKTAMRRRVEAARSSTYSSSRWVVGVTLAFSVLLVVTSREYLRPYDAPGGQVALAAVGALFAVGVGSVQRMGRIREKHRVLADWGQAAEVVA